MRNIFVLIHRYIGLVMAGFLVIAGLTGSLLVWYHELDAWINRDLMHVQLPQDNSPSIAPLDLRDRVAAQYPQANINYMSLHRASATDAAVFYLEAKQGVELGFDELFVNPYSGEILGSRTWGDITQGATNLMPFLYRLHYSLALDTIGTYTFGIIALLWTLDCFIGAYLTFPRRQRDKSSQPANWWKRWWPAWKVRWKSNSYKLNFDLHVAGGLWPWALLFVLAWSSVAFNLHDEVYRPVTASIFGMQDSPYDFPNVSEPNENPVLSWQQANILGQQYMAQLAQEKGFEVIRADRLNYSSGKNFFRYVAKTDRDVGDKYGQTAVFIDATSGEVVGSYIPSGEAAGDTITQWLYSLHMAQVWGLPFRILMTAVGAVVAMLSVTGLIIWLRKRQARQASTRRKSAKDCTATAY